MRIGQNAKLVHNSWPGKPRLQEEKEWPLVRMETRGQAVVRSHKLLVCVSTSPFSFLPFPFSVCTKRRDPCRLRHSGSPERDGLPTGSFTTEWPGSRQEVHAWVKHSWSTHNAPCPACWRRTGLLSEVPDVSVDEAKAGTPRGVPEVRSRLDTSPLLVCGGI